MNSGIERIVFNRDLKTEEYVSLSFFMVGFMQKYRMKTYIIMLKTKR